MVGCKSVKPGKSDGAPRTDQEVNISLLLTDKDTKLTVGPTSFDPLPFTRDARGKLNTSKLIEKLKELKVQFPQKSNITLQTEDGVHYEDMVRVIDTSIGAGFPGVAVTGAT